MTQNEQNDRRPVVFQIDGMARLQQLTPELYAHYADEPMPTTGEDADAEGDDSATL